MGAEKSSERLTEDQVHAKAVEIWPTVSGWVEDGRAPYEPQPGSQLSEDDKVVQNMHLSFLARFSLVCGAEHLMTALAYSNNHGPTLFSMQTLLRTALVGGAQAVWLLSPKDQATRVERANLLSTDAYIFQLQWADELKDLQDPDFVDPQELEVLRKNLATLTGGERRPKVHMTTLVKEASDHLYPEPSEGHFRADYMAEFRHLCSAAHALPWNLNIRAEKQAFEHAGQPGTYYLPSWSHLQGAISGSYIFLRIGWKLLEEQGATPSDPDTNI